MTISFIPLNIAILTVSDTRKLNDDASGNVLQQLVAKEGHNVADRRIVRDNVEEIVSCLRKWIENTEIDIVLSTGGTGVTGRDVTPEAMNLVYDKEIPGFGELFRYLSYEKIGAATIQSRATAGVAKGTYLFALPGSPSACRDGWDMILKNQLDNRTQPCNFVSLLPRLRET